MIDHTRRAWQAWFRWDRLWFLVHLPAVLFATKACWTKAGWPINHEFYAHFERVEAFRRAYLAGDWFPLWTPFSNNGHGSPIPFFYHRLFNTIAGALSLIAGSSYIGVKLAVILVTFIGAVGMDRAILVVCPRRSVRILGAALLVMSWYALIDWLTRGSTAEYTAFMLMPWLYGFALRAARGERVGGRLGFVFALIFFAHNAMAYFAALIPLIGGIVSLSQAADRDDLKRRMKVFAVALAVVLAIAGPYIIAIGLAGRFFSLEALNRAWSPLATMLPFQHYLYDPTFLWGKQWHGLSVEIGLPTVVLTILLLGVAGARRMAISKDAAILLGGTLAPYLFLQTHAADWFYLYVPGSFYLGFPWRLLAMITVAVILLLSALIERVSASGNRWRLGVMGALGLTVLLQGYNCYRAQAVEYGRYPRSKVEDHIRALEIPTIGEYLPVGVGGLRRIPAAQPTISWTNCPTAPVVSGDDPAKGLHLRRLVISIASPNGCVVRLNQFHSAFLKVEGAPARRSGAPEGTIELSFPPGTQTATIRPRGLLSLIAASLTGPS